MCRGGVVAVLKSLRFGGGGGPVTSDWISRDVFHKSPPAACNNIIGSLNHIFKQGSDAVGYSIEKSFVSGMMNITSFVNLKC